MSILRSFVTALVLATLATAPAAAQFSDAYTFIKAVRDKDVAKAKPLIDKPGTTIVNARDGDTGETALIIATKRSDVPWMGFVLQAGADANLKDRSGNTPLLLASIAGFEEGVRVLLLVGAKPDLANGLGETPLIKAVQARDAVVAKMLIDAGANADVVDHAGGYSARQYAAQDPRGGPIAKLLKDAPGRTAKPMQGPSL